MEKLHYARTLGINYIDVAEQLDQNFVEVLDCIESIINMDRFFSHIEDYELDISRDYRGQLQKIYKGNIVEDMEWLRDKIQEWQDKGCKILQTDKPVDEDED